MAWQRKGWEADQPAVRAPADPNAGLIKRSFDEAGSVLSAETAEDLLAELEEWIIDPRTPPERGVRVSKKLADGGEPGRWLVIWKTGESDGPYSKDVASRVLKAKRQTSPASNAWMVNIDKLDLTVFDKFCTAAWVYPWLGKWRYYNCWTDSAGEVRIEGPRNLIEAKAFWLAHVEQAKDPFFNMSNPFVLDEKTGLPIFPKNYGVQKKARPNPAPARTPALIRHRVVAVADKLAVLRPEMDDAWRVRMAHAVAWGTAQDQGLVQKKTRKLTKAGITADAQHRAEPNAADKDGRYEALVDGARANPTGAPLSGRTTVASARGAREVIPYRAVVRDAEGKKHRPRKYLDPLDPSVQSIVAGHAAMQDVRRIIAHQDESDTLPLEVVPKRRRRGS